MNISTKRLLLNGRRLGCLLGVVGLFVSALRAQVADDAISVPVHFQAMYDATATGDPDQPAHVNVYATGISGPAREAYGDSGSGGLEILTPSGFARLRPGKTYVFGIDAYSSTRVRVKITPPSGHRVFINGVEHEMFDWAMGDGGLLSPQGSFSVRLDDGSGGAVGEAAALRPGRVLWSVGLGNLRNGKPAGSLRLAEDGLTANTFKPAALYFDRDSKNQNGSYVGDDGEVTIVKVNNLLRQVYATTVLTDIVAQNDHAFSIRLFARTDVPAEPDGQGVYNLAGKTPLHEFLIENPVYPALTALRISKTTNQNGTLIMWTEMAKTVPTAGITIWTVHDWVEKAAAATAVTSPVQHRWTYTDNDLNEVMEVLDGAGTVAQSVFKRYADLDFGIGEISRELSYEITGYNGTAPVRTDYVYHQAFTEASSGNWHKIAGVTSTDGSWATFYYRNEFRNRGQIFQLRKPHGNLQPSDPGSSITAGTEVTTFDYGFRDNWGTERLPTKIETVTDGVPTARSEFSYTYETVTDSSTTYQNAGNEVMPLIVVTRKDYANANDYLTSVTRAYREDADPEHKFFPGLPHSAVRPDKTVTAMTYFRAAYSLAGPFTPNQTGGAWVHVALQGTSDATMVGTTAMTSSGFVTQDLPAGFRIAPGKSTEARTLLDSDGLPRVAEQRAYVVGGNWVVTKQDWSSYADSFWPSITTRRTADSGLMWNVINNTWTAGRLSATVDETGVRQSFGYDTVGRVQTVTKDGATAAGATIAAQTVTQTFDAAGRVKTRTTSGGGETLVATSHYDTAGRVTSQTAPGQGTTSFVYDVASRLTTVTLPTTFTQIETRLRDGRPLSVTGTAVVGEFYDYGIETDGRRRTKVSARSANDVRKQESWTDWLGRAAKRERPGFNGTSTYTETMEYAATTGQLTVLNRTGYAATRYEYNGMGEAVRTGLDLNGTAGLQPASKDRISDSDTSVESYDGAYWVTSKSWAFHLHNTDAKKLVGQSRRRLTGLSPTLRGETRSWDAEDNESRRSVSVDVATKVVTATTTRPGLASAATEVSVNGFAVVSTGHDGLAYRQTYDALGRVQSVIDPRTGTANAVSGANFSITYVPNTALPFERRDGSNKLLSSTAYDGAGRPIMTQNADSRTSRVAYTARGQVEYQWGSAGYPVSYGYDGYGQRTHLRTYRDPSNSVSNYWEATTWPGGAVAAQDTEWAFDDYTGLLKKKYDASRQYTEYTYNTRGQTHQRFWARTVPTGPNAGQRITTTYAYVAGTGEPQSISYNDGITPGVSYLPGGGGEAYTRLGQPVAVTDATGERSFGYDATKPWRLTGETLSSTFYGSRALASLYEENTTANTGDGTYTGHTISTVKGRYRGYRLGVNPTAGSYDLEQSYAGSAAGRLAGLETKRASGGATRQFIYGYETASPLLKSLAIVGNAFQVTRTFEAKRDLLTQIDSKWGGGALRTSYAYTYNDLRQRATAVQGGGAGEAFAELGATHQRFAYNSRGELTAGTGYHGSDPAATDKPLDARLHAYDYDAIGNRKWSNSSGNAVVRDDYTANDLNQYTQRENNTLAVSGTANASAKVAVSGPMPAPDGGQVRAGRPTGGTYWGSNVVVNNAATTAEGKGVPFVGDVKAYAALAGAGAGGADLFRVETKAAWLPPLVQVFAYDVDGNLTSDGLWDYTWDAENRLIRMQTTGVAATVASAGRPNQTLEFTYDYRHRRVKKKVINMATSTVTSERKFIYDGWNVIAETDVGGTIKRSFAWGLDISGSAQGAGGVGGLLQIHDYEQTKTLFPCYDGNGNICALINAEGTAAGTIEASYEYSPFGELQRCAGAYAAANPFRFSTKWQDDESGLVYYGARYYAPREGRFLGRDPIEEEGGLNLYGFCGNDGVNQTDYLGYSWFSKQLKSIGNWVSKNKQAIITVVAIVASIYIGGLAINAIYSSTASSIATTTAANIAAGKMGAMTVYANSGVLGGAVAGGTISGTTASVLAGMAGGAAGGAIAGGITTGTVKGALQGAAAGAIMGGVQGYYTGANLAVGKPGQAFPVSRVPVTGVAGGLASKVQGGRFRDGFILSGAIAAGTKLNLWMREEMVRKNNNPANFARGADGLNDDGYSHIGGRQLEGTKLLKDDGFTISPKHIQPLGGFQGGPLLLFGMEVTRGGLVENVLEHFAGPHDWLGSYWSYNSNGNNEPLHSLFGQFLGKAGSIIMDISSSVVDIPLAAPIAAAPGIGLSTYSGIGLTSAPRQ